MAITRHTLKDFPIYFNAEELPFPSTWTENSEVVETINQTEAGTQQVEVVRYDRLSVSVGYVCTDTLAKKLKAFSKQNSINVSYYDIETDDYLMRVMRMRKFSANLRKGSADLLAVRGVWDISFTLEEF